MNPIKRRGLPIEWRNDVPPGMMNLAGKRTRDMLAHYGRNITSMAIETLVASCYLQGIEDCFKYHEKRERRTMEETGLEPAPRNEPVEILAADAGQETSERNVSSCHPKSV